MFVMEKNDKNKEKKSLKKDYYTLVMVCQVISAVMLFLVYLLIICASGDVKREFLTLLGTELWDTNGIIETVKNYFAHEGAWRVIGGNVTYVAETEVLTTSLTGTGGEDIEIYEAANNASFAPLKGTVPAVKPVEKGRYTSLFGYRINPITREFSFHTGVDIAAAEGTQIRAAYIGKVEKVGEDSKAGKYIILSHDNGFFTFYCHCSEITAEEGDNIKQGNTIAKVGSTGWSTGPHLHFEIRKNHIRYNPVAVLENDS